MSTGRAGELGQEGLESQVLQGCTHHCRVFRFFSRRNEKPMVLSKGVPRSEVGFKKELITFM
jgi:hypothetical protein